MWCLSVCLYAMAVGLHMALQGDNRQHHGFNNEKYVSFTFKIVQKNKMDDIMESKTQPPLHMGQWHECVSQPMGSCIALVEC